ncbi:hypothetical protein [Domibacillus robiginosus]|uniref:hypothetical protein n=1 Tax=Domibacillus robiginosus TaxID=1071054 RepID=UPI00067E3B01|nr:hypothetical protein [Domibacillus robiginosus]
MTKAKSLFTDSSSPKRADLFSIPGVMRASDLKPAPSSGTSAGEWKEFVLSAFRTRLSAEKIKAEPYQTEYAAKELYQSLLKKTPLDREWAVLFRLFASFYSFSALADGLEEADLAPEVAERAAYDVLFYFADEAYDAAKMTGTALPFAFESYIEQLREDAGRLLSFPFEQFPAARLDMYRLLWESLFIKTEWRTAELEWIVPTPGSNAVQHAAFLHQLYLLGDMDQFVTSAASAPGDTFPYFLHWLQSAKRSGRFTAVLRGAVSLARDGLLTIENEYSRRLLVRQVIRLVEEDEVIELAPLLVKELYTCLLPFSYVSLSYFLIGRGDYAEWVDLQILVEADITDLDRAGLKSVIKEEPELALPLLHHGIAAFIAQKNRASYKKAVRFIKRMRTIYKKLKQTDEFDRWLEWTLGETRRLRAFQEECRKGGLLDD